MLAKTAAQKPKILYDGCPIALNSNVKYLGLWIDENLNFDIYLKFLERKIAYAVGILNKLKCYFPKKLLLQLYHAIIYPHFNKNLSSFPYGVLPTNLISIKFQLSKTKLLGSLPRQNGIPGRTFHIPT